MKEVDFQSLVIKSVRHYGGAAHKMSSRFLVGVSDLLVCINGRSGLFEVKIATFSAKTPEQHDFKLEVTEPQKEFLRRFDKAGMTTGVLYGVKHGSRLKMRILTLATCERRGYRTVVGDCDDLGRGPDEQYIKIFDQLRSFL